MTRKTVPWGYQVSRMIFLTMNRFFGSWNGLFSTEFAYLCLGCRDMMRMSAFPFVAGRPVTFLCSEWAESTLGQSADVSWSGAASGISLTISVVLSFPVGVPPSRLIERLAASPFQTRWFPLLNIHLCSLHLLQNRLMQKVYLPDFFFVDSYRTLLVSRLYSDE
jgi:hypothetical protein